MYPGYECRRILVATDEAASLLYTEADWGGEGSYGCDYQKGLKT